MRESHCINMEVGCTHSQRVIFMRESHCINTEVGCTHSLKLF